MSIPVQEAAEILAPILSSGADVALRELANQAGSAISKPATELIEKIKRYFSAAVPSTKQVEQALDSGLASGVIDGDEIVQLVQIAETNQAGRDTVKIQGRTVFHGSTFNVSRNMNVDGG